VCWLLLILWTTGSLLATAAPLLLDLEAVLQLLLLQILLPRLQLQS
jgi:hypothetical protein